MLKILFILVVLLLGKDLKRWEREKPFIFGGVSILLVITFSWFNEVLVQPTQTSPIMEENIVVVLNGRSGNRPDQSQNSSFLDNGPPRPPKNPGIDDSKRQ